MNTEPYTPTESINEDSLIMMDDISTGPNRARDMLLPNVAEQLLI
jgi:hypothetical protein